MNLFLLLCDIAIIRRQDRARQILAAWDRARGGDELAEQHRTRDYGRIDVHRRFVIGEHRDFLDSRSQIPHFFCWPAWQVLTLDDDPDEAADIHDALSLHRPPFTADEDRGVTTVEIARLDEDRLPAFLSDFFASLALYDLTRQWVAKPRHFVWDRFTWKRPLTPDDIDRLKARFVATYDIDMDSIALS